MLIAFKKIKHASKIEFNLYETIFLPLRFAGNTYTATSKCQEKEMGDEEDVLYSAQKDATSARTRTTEGLTQAESEKNEDI